MRKWRRLAVLIPILAAAGWLGGCAALGLGGASASGAGATPPGMPNSLLWRAALEVIRPLPLRQADAQAGVIISDWRAGTDAPNERFRVTIYVLDHLLRADALGVSLFRQERASGGAQWRDVEASAEAVRALEDAILTRARALHIAGQPGG